MNDLVTITDGQAVTMTSREIAELTGKRHDHVMRDLRKLKEDLGDMFGGSPQTWGHPQNGQTYEEFALDKDTCLTLLLGYDAVARMRVVKRWQELEAQAQRPAFDPASLTRADILQLALDSEQKRMEAEAKVIELEPKAKFHDKVVAAPGALTIAEAAKTLGTGRNRLAQWLRQNRWCRRNNEPYQSSIDAGLLDVKLGEWEHPERGLQRSVTTLVTGKGLAKLQSLGAGHAAGRDAA